MSHLKNLKIVNYVLAALCLMGALLCLLIAVGWSAFTLAMGGELDAVIGMVVGLAIGAIVEGVVAMVLFTMGGQVARAKGRMMQTIIAILCLCNCPLTPYGAYALWVCWMNAETKPLFDQGYIDEY